MLGRRGELVGELEAPCREHPLRERLWELLCSPSPGPAAAGPCAPTPKSVTAWPASWASTPARRWELPAQILAQDPSLAAAGPAGLAAVPAPMARAVCGSG